MDIQDKTNLTVAIHQPNFFPWLGYFNKILNSDIFVFLDNVDMPRTGSGNWVNRTWILIQNSPAWMTCPISKAKSGKLIKEQIIDSSRNWEKKFMETLKCNYGKCLCFDEFFPHMMKMLEQKCDNIAEFNIRNIKYLCDLLDIQTEFIYQSELNTTARSTDLMIEIVKKAGGNIYLSGTGAKKYHEESKFDQEGIILKYQSFECMEYKQYKTKEFIPGVSIIDCIFNVGIKNCKSLLSQKT